LKKTRIKRREKFEDDQERGKIHRRRLKEKKKSLVDENDDQ
jgi:hypothetical protein